MLRINALRIHASFLLYPPVTIFIALKNSQPKKTKNNEKKTKATKKLEKKVENLKAEVAKLKISQSINGGCGPKDQKLKSKNRLLGGEVSGLKTQVNNLQSRIVTLTDGLKCLLGKNTSSSEYII